MSYRPFFRGGPGGFHGGGGGGFGRFPGGGGMFPRRPMLGAPGLMGHAPRQPRFARPPMPRGAPRFGGPRRQDTPPKDNRGPPEPKKDEPPEKKIKEEPKADDSKEKSDAEKKPEEQKPEEKSKSEAKPAVVEEKKEEKKEEKASSPQKTPEKKPDQTTPSPKQEETKGPEPHKAWQQPNRGIRPLGMSGSSVPSLLSNMPPSTPKDQGHVNRDSRSWDNKRDQDRSGGPPWSEPRKRPHPDNRDNRGFGRRQSFPGRRGFNDNDGIDPGLEEPNISPSEVCLDFYNSDINLQIDPECYSAESITEPKGFCFCWGGARCTFGVTKGKVCFEVNITSHLSVDFGQDHKEDHPHVVRVGWSTDASSFQLGEEMDSFGFGGTGKFSHNSKFQNYGQPFGAGDVITAMLDFTARPPNISYAKNGRWLGVAFPLRNWKVGTPQKALFPHILSKNCRFEVNFGQRDPSFPTPPGFVFIGHMQPHELVPGMRPPDTKGDCEMIMMVGLPGVGKTTWGIKKAKENPQKRYNIIGTDTLIDKMKVMGLPRKKNFHGRWENLIQMASNCLNKMFQIGSRRRRNFILDQTNVYATARRRKLKNFTGFRRVCAVLQPVDEEMERRAKTRTEIEGKYVPESAVLEMKKNFALPEDSDPWVDEIIFIDLDRETCIPLLQRYNEQGAGGPGRTVFPKEQRPDKPAHPDRLAPWQRKEPEPWKRKQEEKGGPPAKQDKPWQQGQDRDKGEDQRPPWQRQDDRRSPWQRNQPGWKAEDRERSPWSRDERHQPSQDRPNQFGRQDNRPAWQKERQEEQQPSWQQEVKPDIKEEHPWQQHQQQRPWQQQQPDKRMPWQREGMSQPTRPGTSPVVKEEPGSALDFIKNQYSEGRDRSPSQEAGWADRVVKEEPVDHSADRWGRQESRGPRINPPSLFDQDTSRGFMGAGRGRGRGQDLHENAGRGNDWYGGAKTLLPNRDRDNVQGGFPRDRFGGETDRDKSRHQSFDTGGGYGNESNRFGRGSGPQFTQGPAGRGRGQPGNRFGEGGDHFNERNQFGHQVSNKDVYGRQQQDSYSEIEREPGFPDKSKLGSIQSKEDSGFQSRWGNTSDPYSSQSSYDSPHGDFNPRTGPGANRYGNQLEKQGGSTFGRGDSRFGQGNNQEKVGQFGNEGSRFGQGMPPAGRGSGAREPPGQWSGGGDKNYGTQWGQNPQQSSKDYYGQGDDQGSNRGSNYYGGGDESYYGGQQSWGKGSASDTKNAAKGVNRDIGSSQWGSQTGEVGKGTGESATDNQYDWQGYAEQYDNYQWEGEASQSQKKDTGKKDNAQSSWAGSSAGGGGGSYGSSYPGGSYLEQYTWNQQQSGVKPGGQQSAGLPKQEKEKKRRSRWGDLAPEQEQSETEIKMETPSVTESVNVSGWPSVMAPEALLGMAAQKGVTPPLPPQMTAAALKLPAPLGVESSAATAAAITSWQPDAFAGTPWQYTQTPTSMAWPPQFAAPPPPGHPPHWLGWAQPPAPPAVEKPAEPSPTTDDSSSAKTSKPATSAWNSRPGLLGAFQEAPETKEEPATTGYEQLGAVDKTGPVLQPALPATAGYTMGMGIPHTAAMPWGHAMGLGVGMRPVIGVPAAPPGLPLIRGVAPGFPAVAGWPPM